MKMIDDWFERVYYKVINYDTNEIVFEKEFTKNISNKLGIKGDAIRKAVTNKKKPYYTHSKTGVNYKFIRLEK